MVNDFGQEIIDFDPHFKIFHDLMLFKVQEILLVSKVHSLRKAGR